MNVLTNYPGVYAVEIPSGTRTITGIATSVTAFVGRTRRGRIDRPIRCFSFEEFTRRCGALWAESELGHAVAHFFLNGGGEIAVARAVDGADPAGEDFAAGAEMLALEAADPGDWGNALRVTISHEPPLLEDLDESEFHLTVEEVDREIEESDLEASVLASETFRFVSLDPASPRYLPTLLADRSALLRVPAGAAIPTTRLDEADRVPLVDGSDGTAPGPAALSAAIALLDLADTINLVNVPPPAEGGSVPASVLDDALAYCERANALLLLDPPASWGDVDAAAGLSGLTALRSANVAVFFPRITAPDPIKDGLSRVFAPGGAVAGVIARTDSARGIWKAPAGQDTFLRGTTGLEFTLLEEEMGILNSRGVNALRTLPPLGPVIWGARTARGADTLADEWKYIPVRRTALFIKESLRRGLLWAVHEPNDEPLWKQIRVAVGGFMDQLFRAGAFQGSRPRDAYLVRCDASTTLPSDIDRGIVNVIVGFAPLKPAEFVVLKFQQLAGTSDA